MPNSKNRSLLTRLILMFLLFLVGLIWILHRAASTPVQEKTIPQRIERELVSPSKWPRATAVDSLPEVNDPVFASGPRAPQPMKLDKRVLVSSEWNSSSNAFGLDKPLPGQEGATVGPSSVAYANGNIYVLDNVNKRVLRYDDAGNLLATISLPTKGATDITTDNLGVVVVIDHHYDRVYKIEGDTAVLIGSPAAKKEFPIGTKFHYDTASNTLEARDVDADGLAKVNGNNLVIALGEGKEFAIGFESPVACVEEVMTDPQGIVWVLYTLEGDYRIRRLARVDPVQGSVEVAQLDVWFAFDATRHMAPTQKGVVLFAGDGQEGRLISFAYAGK